ncbi:MAG: hypothetical protein JWL59_1149 [Chthoniobacteraceae bacterium]|nr:hypothetical protein [Chthoniobacteraceae bacterium]
MFRSVIPLLLLSLPAMSAELIWGSSGNGGSSTWNTTTANWFDGTNAVTWPTTTTGGSAIFDGTPGTVTVFNSLVYAEKLEFRTAGYLIEGSLLESSPNGLTFNTLADATSNASIYSGEGANARVFTKTGPATLTLKTLAFFDQVNVLSGELRASTSSGVNGSAQYYFNPSSSTRLTLEGYIGDNFSVGGLQGGNAEIYPLDSSSAGSSGKRSLSIFNRGGSFSGVLRDNGANTLALAKYTGSQQELAGTNTYSGPTTIYAGAISFAGSGSALNTVFTVNSGATLLLDNTTLAQSNRISDSAALSLSGTLTLKGNALAPVSEKAGNLIPVGLPLVQVLADPFQPATLTFQSLTPAATGTVLPVFTGTHLGAVSGPGVASIRFVNVPSLVGGDGAVGSTTLSILAGIYGGEAGPESLVTYGANGVRPLSEDEYLHDSLSAGANVSLTTPVTVAGVQSVNALRVQDGSAVLGSGTLTVASGTILALPGNARLMENKLNFGSATGTIFTVGNLVIKSSITGSGGLRKSGLGTLTLAGANSYSGFTEIIAGTVRLENDSALGNTGTYVSRGAALELIGGLSIAPKSLAFSGSGPHGRGALRNLGGDNAWAGDIYSGLDGVIGVEAGSLSFSGNFSDGYLTKIGAGLLRLSGNTNELARISLSGGTLRFQAIASSSAVGLDQIALNYGRLELAPAGVSSEASIILSRRNPLTYTSGAALLLDRGRNSSLTVTVGGPSGLDSLTREESGTLVIVPGSGQLGTVEKLKLTTAFIQQNGIVPSSIVMEEADSQRSASFLAYDAVAGFVRATPTAPAGSTLQTAGANAYFLAQTPQTLTASASLYALQNQGQLLDLGTSTLTFNTAKPDTAGLILNGGIIRGGTLQFLSEAVIYTSLAGATIASDISSSASFSSFFPSTLTFFGPGVVTLSGDVSASRGFFIATVNSGTLKIDGSLQGKIEAQPEATLAGSGRVKYGISGGLISPGSGPGILTALQVERAERIVDFRTVISPTSFAFEFSRTGLPDFSHSAASGNDLLRLTDATAPFTTLFDSETGISLYFQTNGLQPGDQFYGGFYTDLRADFSAAFQNATVYVYQQDPAGSVLFGGQHYSLDNAVNLAITTTPLSADFGDGLINGQIMRVQVVIPEPCSTALLSIPLAVMALRRRRQASRITLG